MRYLFLLSSVLLLFSCATTPAPVVRQTSEQMERAEFEALMKLDSINKNQNAAESLDILLNDGDDGKRVSVIINNKTNCNIIVRFAGAQFYNLPIYKNRMNFIVLEKGSYAVGANLCSSRYSSYLQFTDSVTLSLSESSAK